MQGEPGGGGWRDALAIAERPAPAQEWRTSLARAVRAAAGATFTGVFTCPPGDWARAGYAADPPSGIRLMERIGAEFVPQIERVGESWAFALAHHGPVYAPIETARAQWLARQLRDEVLTPAGIRGYVVGFIADRREALLGVVAVGAHEDSSSLLRRIRAPLTEVVETAGRAIEAAIELAKGCGAQVPEATDPLAPLTARERQVAMLVVEGLSNLNVAARLGIAEETVGVHLRRIYGKLSIHSRVELTAACLRPGWAAGRAAGDS